MGSSILTILITPSPNSSKSLAKASISVACSLFLEPATRPPDPFLIIPLACRSNLLGSVIVMVSA